MQILHRFASSIQRYSEELSDPNRYRPDHCPQCCDEPTQSRGAWREGRYRPRLTAFSVSPTPGLSTRHSATQVPTVVILIPPQRGALVCGGGD
jgi:hypothetical protein